jgi:hypothetical protein
LTEPGFRFLVTPMAASPTAGARRSVDTPRPSRAGPILGRLDRFPVSLVERPPKLGVLALPLESLGQRQLIDVVERD